jgi:hypothetical protein
MSTPRTFPLPSRAPGDHRRAAQISLLILLVIVATYFSLVVVDAALGLSRGTVRGDSIFVEVGILAFVMGATVVGYLGLGPGAVECTWDANGFYLRFESGRIRRFLWGTRGFHCTVTEYRSPQGLASYYISTVFPTRCPLSQELFEAILDEAANRRFAQRRKLTSLPSGVWTDFELTAPSALVRSGPRYGS